MQLIAPAASGIAGAAAGTLDIYKRGTSSRATAYQNFDASGPYPSTSITLDSNGGATVYVNEPVDCVVKSSLGTTVRTFTIGGGAPAVEVISQSFTGVDYTTGQSAVSRPTTVAAILDLWKTQNGQPDWQVDVGGAAKTIKSAVSSLAGLFVNVKDATYGAKGDGGTDDSTAIDAAVAAASATGGIVFFPPGTYRRTTAMVMPGNVDLWGCGPSASFIRQDTAAADLLSYTTGTKDWQTVQGLRLGYNAASATNKTLIRVNGATRLRMVGNYLGDSNTLGGCAFLTNASGLIEFLENTLEVGTNGATTHVSASQGKSIRLVSNRFVCPATMTGQTVVTVATCDLVAMFNEFELGTVTVGTPNILRNTTAGQRFVAIGNAFQSMGAGSCTALVYFSITNCFEFGNSFGTGVTPYQVFGGGSSATTVGGNVFGTRTSQSKKYPSDAATLSIEAATYAEAQVVKTTAAAQTLTFDDPLSANEEFVLMFTNTNGGAPTGTITVTAVSGAVIGLATFTVNASKSSAYFFKSVMNQSSGANPQWFLVGSQVNF